MPTKYFNNLEEKSKNERGRANSGPEGAKKTGEKHRKRVGENES
jgi:hypothetical protein